MTNIGFCGLGVMGYPMAGHLVRAKHNVVVFNRTPSRALQWVSEYGSRALPSPAEVATESDVVFVCVGNDDDVRQVMLAEAGILDGARPGLIVVDHTTTSAQLARDMFESCAAHEVIYIDAPVSGGQAGAENGQLSIMCGGTVADFDRAAPVIDAYAKICRRMGDVGAGQMTKMCNQIAIAGLVQALSESLAFAQKAGLDVADVVEVISQGAAGSWQMVNRHATMHRGEFEHGFAVDWMRKDLAICLQAGDQLGAALPVTALVDQFYKDVQAMGGGRWDTSSLIARLTR